MGLKSEIWDIGELYKTPESHLVEEFQVPGLKSLYYSGLSYKGKPTEVYSYYGTPEGKSPKGGWPAVVLVHGGGGTAYPQYVKWWNHHGYAAIIMDLEGHLPELNKETKNRPSVAKPGPCRENTWDDIEKPVDEQWFYHCIAQVVLAHSLIRSFSEINLEKTGIAGVSWGGIITCFTIGIDGRFKFAVPVYGCIALVASDGAFGEDLKKKSPEQLKRFVELWDGTEYLAKSKIPTLWINGTNDKHFPLDAWQKSINTAGGQTIQRTEIRMPHGHDGFMSTEAVAFANGIINCNTVLPSIGTIEVRDEKVSVKIKCIKEITRAELCYTVDRCKYSNRLWKSIPADISGETISSFLPENTVAFFFNITIENNLMLSSEIKIERKNNDNAD